MKRKEAQHFFKKLKIKGMVICLPVESTKTKVCGAKTGDRVVTCRLIKSMVKYGTSVMFSGKQIAATYCQTEIIINTGISLRNKTMADNQRLF
jgi:hypothetical protein